MRLIRCDRCDKTQSQLVHVTADHIPAGWTSIDGSHLCEECDDLFRDFMLGRAVPAIEHDETNTA